MKTLRIPLRVLVYKEDGCWLARGLEFDLCGDGPTMETAVSMLAQAILIQFEQYAQHSNDADLFVFSEDSYVQRFFAAIDAPAALHRSLATQIAHSLIETVAVRVETTAESSTSVPVRNASSTKTQFSLKALFAMLTICGLLLILPTATKLFWHEIVWLGLSSPRSRANGNLAAAASVAVAAFLSFRIFLAMRRRRGVGVRD